MLQALFKSMACFPRSLSGPVQNQVCGTTIRSGGLQFPEIMELRLLIGSASPASCGLSNVVGEQSCGAEQLSATTTVMGNTVTGNLQDQSNTGPTRGRYSSTVTGNLQCQSNTSITQKAGTPSPGRNKVSVPRRFRRFRNRRVRSSPMCWVRPRRKFHSPLPASRAECLST